MQSAALGPRPPLGQKYSIYNGELPEQKEGNGNGGSGGEREGQNSASHNARLVWPHLKGIL